MAHNPELQYHIQMKKGDVGRYVFLPGDPGRTEKIASYFDDPELIAYNREYKTYTGTLLGEKVSVTSTGIGCPSTAIAVEELIKIGADTFIRIGTSGGMQPGTRTGDVAIVNSAIRDEGTTLHYMPPEFPALADVDVVTAMRSGAEKVGIPYRVGPTQSKDSFFGEVEPDRMPVANRLNRRWKAWIDGGAICSEMEASSIFIISAIHRTRAGGVMLMASLEGNEDPQEREALWDINRAISVAVEGLKILIEQDKKKASR
ncbi:MAG: nucleoside phosphorylase [Brevefilum sp.]